MSPPKEDGAESPGAPGRSELAMGRQEMLDSALEAARIVVDRIVGLPDQAAWKGASRGELEKLLREPPPEEGRPLGDVMERAAQDILSTAGRVDHPRFFAFVPSSPTWPGVLADFMSAGFNIFQGTWLGSSGPSQLELVVTDWFKDWLGYPETAGGLFTSGGSAASLDALVAAREAAGAPDRPAVYMSDQSHTALERAARIVGVRREGVRRVPSDGRFRISMDALARMVDEDVARGFTPIAVCANAGTTNTGAVDPMDEMADFCAERDIWLHVDGAYGGMAVLSDRGKELLKGMARADSITLDAHKWLFQPFEAGCLMVKDVRRLEAAFSVHPEYLQDTEWGQEHINFGDRGLQLTRSFRALKVWMSVQTFGMAAFRRAVGRGIELADRAEGYVKASPTIEMLSPASLGIVCFRANPPAAGLSEEEIEALNVRVQARVIDSQTAMMSSTRLRGTYSLRLCILNHNTTWKDVEDTLKAIERFAEEDVGA